MLRSAPPLRRGALLIRGPSAVGPGSAEQRQGTLHRVRDMETGYFGVGWAFASEASAGLKGSFGGALANIGSG